MLICSDNEPLFAHANVVLEPLLGLSLQGNDAALKDLQLGDPTKPGHFGRHLLTSGIVKLFEGMLRIYLYLFMYMYMYIYP